MIYFCAAHIHNFVWSLLYIGFYHFFIPVVKNKHNFSDYEGYIYLFIFTFSTLNISFPLHMLASDT